MRCLFLLCFTLLFSCSGKEPAHLSPSRMEKVYWDYIQADVLARQNVMRDSTLNGYAEAARLRKDVLKVHGVTKEEMDETLLYYSAHPDKMRTILDSIIAKQQRSRRKPALIETELL